MRALSRSWVVLPAALPLGPVLLAAAVLAAAAIGFQSVCDVPLLVDEIRHFDRIQALRGGHEPAIPASSLHTYHAVLAAISSAVGAESIGDTRLLSLLLGLLCVPAGFGIVRKLDPQGASLAAAQLFFLPILLPFFFLLYTDSLGLLCVLLAVLLAWDGCVWGAALASIAGVLIRQTHVVCMLFAFLLPYVRTHGWRVEMAAVIGHLRRGWLFLLGFAGFAAFVIVNKGVAIGDREYHPAFTLHAGNILFALFVVCVVFLPLHAANLPRIARLLRERPWWLLAVAGGVCFFLFGANFDHPYNDWDHCLRNKVLNRVEDSALYRAVFAAGVVLALLSLAVTELRDRSFTLLYPIAVLSLAPAWLVDPRYTIPALALFALFRARQSWALEWAILGWCALLSLFVLDGIFREVFFL